MPRFAKNAAARDKSNSNSNCKGTAVPGDDVPVFPDAPRWLPRGAAWAALPREVREAAEETIMPLHRELVRSAPSSMERTAGETLVYAAWLEVLEQAELARHLYQPRARDRFERMTLDGGADVDALVDRMLNVTRAKVAAGKFVMKTKALWQELDQDRLFRKLNSPETARNLAAADDSPDPAATESYETEPNEAATVSERPESDQTATVSERPESDRAVRQRRISERPTFVFPPSPGGFLPSPFDGLRPSFDPQLPAFTAGRLGSIRESSSAIAPSSASDAGSSKARPQPHCDEEQAA